MLTDFYIDQIVVMIVESFMQTRFLTMLPKTNSVSGDNAKNLLTDFYINQIAVMIVESFLQTRFLTLLPKTNSFPSNNAKNLLDQ